MNKRDFEKMLTDEVSRRGTVHETKSVGSMIEISKDKDDGSLCMDFSKSVIISNRHPDIRMKPISRRSLGYISILSRFMNYYNTTDIFSSVTGYNIKRITIHDFITPYQIISLKKIKQGVPVYVKLSNIGLTSIGLRNKGRYEIPSQRPQSVNNYTLTQTPDIFVLSLVKTSPDKKEIRIRKKYREQYIPFVQRTNKLKNTKRVAYKNIFKINPKDLVLLVNKDTLMNPSFMRENYSTTIRTNMLQSLQLFELQYETMFGFKPQIVYVDDSEIQKHIRLISEKDNITSLTKIMRIDQQIKEGMFLKQISKKEEYLEKLS